MKIYEKLLYCHTKIGSRNCVLIQNIEELFSDIFPFSTAYCSITCRDSDEITNNIYSSSKLTCLIGGGGWTRPLLLICIFRLVSILTKNSLWESSSLPSIASNLEHAIAIIISLFFMVSGYRNWNTIISFLCSNENRNLLEKKIYIYGQMQLIKSKAQSSDNKKFQNFIRTLAWTLTLAHLMDLFPYVDNTLNFPSFSWTHVSSFFACPTHASQRI